MSALSLYVCMYVQYNPGGVSLQSSYQVQLNYLSIPSSPPVTATYFPSVSGSSKNRLLKIRLIGSKKHIYWCVNDGTRICTVHTWSVPAPHFKGAGTVNPFLIFRYFIALILIRSYISLVFLIWIFRRKSFANSCMTWLSFHRKDSYPIRSKVSLFSSISVVVHTRSSESSPLLFFSWPIYCNDGATENDGRKS